MRCSSAYRILKMERPTPFLCPDRGNGSRCALAVHQLSRCAGFQRTPKDAPLPLRRQRMTAVTQRRWPMN